MAKDKIYDITFKRMFRLSNRMLIKFVNQVFEKHFPLDAKVIFLDTGTENENNEVLEKDLYFEICKERFQIEAQSYWDDMMFRLFEYAVHSTEGNYEKIDATHAVFRMPKQAVVFLKGMNKENDKLYIRVIFPDGQEVEYSIKAVRALGYSPQELAENHLEILLPFQIIRMWREVKNYAKYTENQKERFISRFADMCYNIISTMEGLLRDNHVSNDEYQQMLLIVRDLKDYIYSSIVDISEKGADSMIEKKFVLSYDEAIARGGEKKAREMAERMIKRNEPVEKIEDYTGLGVRILKELASELGTKLVL